TTVDVPYRKALVQITERCNLRCAHCFVSATKHGRDMPLPEISKTVVPRLTEARVHRVTLTGGEPTVHPDFLGIVHAFRDAGIDVGICTNATGPGDDLSHDHDNARAHVNLPLDGCA